MNTDFAQAEVDARQVNLTRFSLLFPEKRDFFLDGTLFFDFASAAEPADGDRAVRDAGPDLIPFFSRRIGLDARNTPQRINFGSKLTGQARRLRRRCLAGSDRRGGRRRSVRTSP